MIIPLHAKGMVGIAVLVMSLTACAGLLDSDEPAERIYWLESYVVPEPVVVAGQQPGLSLTILAAPGLDTDRLLILEPDSRLNHYASARWPDNIPDVIESHLRTTLESSGQFARVTAGPTSHASHRHLDLEIRELYTLANIPGTDPVVRMVLSGYLNCSETDDAIELGADIDVDSNRLSIIVAAYQAALNEVSQQLVSRMRDSCRPDSQNKTDTP